MTAPLRLLLVEDSERDAALLIRQLRREGYDVLCERVDSAAAFLDALDRRPWDVVIADYAVPSFGAIATLELLQRRRSDLPMIIVSGTISEETAVECMKRGAVDYLIKDRLGRLGEAVQRALASRQLRIETRQAEERIRFQARLLDAVEQAVVAHDLEGSISYWNQFAERLYGWPAADVLCRSILDVIPAPESRARAAEILIGLRGGASWSGELRVQRRDGSTFLAAATKSPIHDERGALIGIVGVSMDVTERKRAEQEVEQARAAAEELARLRSDLVAAVSHELRTPLTAIIGFSELLLQRWPHLSEEKRVQRVTNIVAAAHRQARLVDDLLLLSRLDTQAPEITCTQIAIAPLARRAAEEVQGSYPGQIVDLAGAAGVAAHADPERTLQILINLLDNAAKYSPEHSPIALSWEQKAGHVVVRVRDRGPGIPAQGRERLFTRFGRVPGSRMRAGRVGMGLGLYLGQQLAQAMAGTLDLEHTGPRGSTFRLCLPVSVAE